MAIKIKSFDISKAFKNILISFVFILSFLLIFFSKTDYFIVNKVKTLSNEYVSPITKFASFPFVVVANINSSINDFQNLKQQNLVLKEEVIRLKKWQILAIQNSTENKVLKKLLNASDNNLNLVKTASVMSRNDILYGKMININAGTKDGLVDQMTVVNHRGLIGRVIDPSLNKSRVLLLTDPNSSLSVKTVSDEIFSLIQGSDDGVHLVSSFIKNEKTPKVGDLLVTSGTAQIFPPDLLVGKITKVTNNKFYALPFVDFNNIDYVQIVNSK